MNSDITIDLENDFRLNIRTSGVIFHGTKVLLHKNPNHDHYALFGGRIKIGESSIEALKREVKEEMGKEIELIKSVGVIENFFDANEKKYHEILFINQVEFEDQEDKKIDYNLKTVEPGKTLIFEWVELDDLKNIDLRPKIAKELLISDNFPQNVINIGC